MPPPARPVCKIFYSWQSDLPNRGNRTLIHEALDAAVGELRDEDEFAVEPAVDRDTLGVAGAPDIGQTILGKVDGATMFVGDVSIINSANTERPTPNPNVLIEYGYALRSLGAGRTVLVMNTAFGGPEKLPFDLRQKRTTTYHLGADDEKGPVRNRLKETFKEAIRTVLAEVRAEADRARAEEKSLLDLAVESVRQMQPGHQQSVRKYMESLAVALEQLAPPGGLDDERLVEAIEKSASIVDDFGQLAEAVAAVDSKEAAGALFMGLERVLGRYTVPKGFSGTFRDTDFDFFKFVGHELMVVLTAHLVSEGKWRLVRELFGEKFHVSNAIGGEPRTLGFERLSAYTALLDDVRKQRLQSNKISLHAEMLKERHEKQSPVGGVGWAQFLEAELVLYLRNPQWYPRTIVYFGSAEPRALYAASAETGAKNLATIMGCKDAASLRKKLKLEISELGNHLVRAAFTSRGAFPGFDVETIPEFDS